MINHTKPFTLFDGCNIAGYNIDWIGNSGIIKPDKWILDRYNIPDEIYIFSADISKTFDRCTTAQNYVLYRNDSDGTTYSVKIYG